MREIKFRCWNKNKNKMEFFTGIFNRRPYTEMSTFPQYESCPEYHKLEIMQYTGLKDKNGREIYEGDIVYEIGRYILYEVVYADGCFTMNGRLFKKDLGEYNPQPEIIGNIYENPEFLTKEEQNGNRKNRKDRARNQQGIL